MDNNEAGPTEKRRERGSVYSFAYRLQGVACHSEQGVHVAMVEVGQQLVGFLFQYLHQIPPLLPPHQRRRRSDARSSAQCVSGEEVLIFP